VFGLRLGGSVRSFSGLRLIPFKEGKIKFSRKNVKPEEGG